MNFKYSWLKIFYKLSFFFYEYISKLDCLKQCILKCAQVYNKHYKNINFFTVQHLVSNMLFFNRSVLFFVVPLHGLILYFIPIYTMSNNRSSFVKINIGLLKTIELKLLMFKKKLFNLELQDLENNMFVEI